MLDNNERFKSVSKLVNHLSYTLNKNKRINLQVKSYSSRNSEQVWCCPHYNKQQCSAGSSVQQKKHKGIIQFPKEVRDYLSKELSYNALLGPFKGIPFKRNVGFPLSIP